MNQITVKCDGSLGIGHSVGHKVESEGVVSTERVGYPAARLEVGTAGKDVVRIRVRGQRNGWGSVICLTQGQVQELIAALQLAAAKSASNEKTAWC